MSRWEIDGWVRPRPEGQLTLFPENRDEFLARARVSPDELKRWRQLGWISFDAQLKDELHDPELYEIVFVRNLARSGFSDAQVTELLSGLPKPYRYNPARTAYSFSYGWVQPEMGYRDEEVDGIIEDGLEDWLKGLASDGDLKTLLKIKGQVEAAVIEAVGQMTNRSASSKPLKHG